jgi:hypothetical protein
MFRAGTRLSDVSQNATNTSRPSLAGVLEAWLLSLCLSSSGARITGRLQSRRPEAASWQRSSRSCDSGSQATTNTRPPATIGEA